MAEIVRTAPVGGAEVGYAEMVPDRPRVSWGAIFAGAVTALALWLLLYSFGLAVGLTVIDPSDTGSLKSSGIFTGIWGLVAPLVALFVGGLVAGAVVAPVVVGAVTTVGFTPAVSAGTATLVETMGAFSGACGGAVAAADLID